LAIIRPTRSVESAVIPFLKADGFIVLRNVAGRGRSIDTRKLKLSRDTSEVLKDIRKIEGRVGKLDKRHATWLWCRFKPREMVKAAVSVN